MGKPRICAGLSGSRSVSGILPAAPGYTCGIPHNQAVSRYRQVWCRVAEWRAGDARLAKHLGSPPATDAYIGPTTCRDVVLHFGFRHRARNTASPGIIKPQTRQHVPAAAHALGAIIGVITITQLGIYSAASPRSSKGQQPDHRSTLAMAAPATALAWSDPSRWSSSLTRAEMAGRVRRVNELERPRRIVGSADRGAGRL
jgi:hypothetical protein